MARGKTPKLGASSPSPSAKEQGSPAQALVRGLASSSLAEVPRVLGLRLRSSSTAMAKDPSGRAVEPPLEVIPIYVWSPPTQSTELPPPMSKDVGRGPFGAEGDEDLLLAKEELAAGAITSILQNSDLRKADALPVEEALALSL